VRLHVSREKDGKLRLADAGWDDTKVVQPDGRAEHRVEVQELQAQIAELRGEFKAMRGNSSSLGLVDVAGNKLKRNGVIDAH
jgi:hypothetical protein